MCGRPRLSSRAASHSSRATAAGGCSHEATGQSHHHLYCLQVDVTPLASLHKIYCLDLLDCKLVNLWTLTSLTGLPRSCSTASQHSGTVRYHTVVVCLPSCPGKVMSGARTISQVPGSGDRHA